MVLEARIKIYDKHRTVDSVLAALVADPKQEMNTVSSMSGGVVEMEETASAQGPAFSLSELEADITQVKIFLEDGWLRAERTADGWVAVDSHLYFPEG